MAAPDVGPIATAIEAALTPIAAVGGAVLLVMVAQWVWRIVRAPIDEQAELEAFHDDFMARQAAENTYLDTLDPEEVAEWERRGFEEGMAMADEEGDLETDDMVCPICGGDGAETDDPDIESGVYCTECGYDGSHGLE